MIHSFAAKIKDLRKTFGYSQEYVAKKLGITPQGVSKWECSQSYPDIELLPDIAKLFGTTIDYLLIDAVTSTQSTLPFPDDDIVRVVICKGMNIIDRDTADIDPPSINLDAVSTDCNVEILGNCNISGDLICDKLSLLGDLSCNDIFGDVNTKENFIKCNPN